MTDPPYHLTTNKKGGRGPASVALDNPYGRARIGTGFKGMTRDGRDVAQRVEVWAEARRVLKPGGHLLAFFSSRTYNPMTCAIEDTGFEIRDQRLWLYSTGFPKSLDVRKAVAKKDAEAAQQWGGWDSALKPTHEPICIARKPLVGTIAQNVLLHGKGALNIDACRVPVAPEADESQLRTMSCNVRQVADGWGMFTVSSDTSAVVRQDGRWLANLIHDGSDDVLAIFLVKPTRTPRCAAPKPASPPRTCKASVAARQALSMAILAAPPASSTSPRLARPTGSSTRTAYLVLLVTPPSGLVLEPSWIAGPPTWRACPKG